MSLFALGQIYQAHHKLIEPLNRNVHITPVFCSVGCFCSFVANGKRSKQAPSAPAPGRLHGEFPRSRCSDNRRVTFGCSRAETVKAYLRDDVIHVEVVLIVAIIALARKVIILELKEPSPLTLVGLAALVVSLAFSYRLIMQVLSSRQLFPEKQ